VVDSIKPTINGAPITRSPYNPRSTTNEVEHVKDKGQDQPRWQRVERRQGHDRRRQSSEKHPKFEMRNSSGRRKGDRPTPSIEIEA